MSESSTEHADPSWPHPESAAVRDAYWRPGAAWPDPAEPSGSTVWGEQVSGRAPSPDQASPWSAGDLPAAVPPPIAGIDGPHTRPGWLTRGRNHEGTGAA